MNISSTLCWCNVYACDSLQNVGPDVVCVRQGTAIKFFDCKKNTVSYFKCENAATGLDISAYCGHYRYPFFAIAEVILRPNIYVYKYPEMTRYNSLPRPKIVQCVNLCFSDNDTLIALGGYPDYAFCLYNFRSGQLILQAPTNVACDTHCMIIEAHQLPIYVQQASMQPKLYCYNLLMQEKKASLQCIAEVPLGEQFKLSNKFFMAFGDGSYMHAVDDYGCFYTINYTAFALAKAWSPEHVNKNIKKEEEGATAEEEDTALEPRRHMLLYYKNGFLISNVAQAHYIRLKGGKYQLEWQIDHFEVEFEQMRANLNGEIYALNARGAIFTFTVENNTAVTKNLSGTGAFIKDYALVHGIKDETILLLQPTGTLVLVDCYRAMRLSILNDLNATAIVAHPVYATVAVGTATGCIMLISYEKVQAPVILYQLECNTPEVFSLQFYEQDLLFEDINGDFKVLRMDLKPVRLNLIASIDEEELTKVVTIVKYFLIGNSRILFFVTRDDVGGVPYANELWLVHWALKEKKLHRIEYALPGKYMNFSLLASLAHTSSIEFAGVLYDSRIFEIFHVSEENELRKVSSQQTTHFVAMHGILATKHILTWGIDGIMVHFRTHKRSSKPFMMSRYLKLFFASDHLLRAEECFNFKYLVTFYATGLMRVVRLPSLADNIRENISFPIGEDDAAIEPVTQVSTTLAVATTTVAKEVEFSKMDLRKREMLYSMIGKFSQEVSELIDYDMAVTGKSQGIFKKFCFNYEWLEELTKQARLLCIAERESIELAIKDQERIRDWILKIILSDADGISYKVRAIFADAHFENFALRKKTDMQQFDKFRFYDYEQFRALSIEEEHSLEDIKKEAQKKTVEEDGVEKEHQEFKQLKRFVVEGSSVFEHMMAPAFALQDKNLVTTYQFFNDYVKYRHYLNEPLKIEFNKLFHECQQLKQETIDNVRNTNATLTKIYSNMNIMLRLLKMDTFVPPQLSSPSWARDEIVRCILEVDDCELKAVNRRRRKTIDTGGKRGRMLLWTSEFWERALITMMDGVIEKLWEEEIKKEIPIPEFALKKTPHEFSLDEQKLYRIYEEAVVLLAEDRRKYLRILNENETKTLELKAQQILKLNNRVTELMRLKLKYDYALKQNVVGLLNLYDQSAKRADWRKCIKSLREKLESVTNYIGVYGKFSEFCEVSMADVKARLETVQARDKAVDRQFRSHFLTTVQHASHEMTKLYRKRPKIPPKVFHSPMICQEAANKLSGKQQQRMPFPLSQEVHEFLALIEEHDDVKNCPPMVDQRAWETFTKLRRQKIESELKIKGVVHHQSDLTATKARIDKEIAELKQTKANDTKTQQESVQKYVECMRNSTLQLTLTLGQVEMGMKGTFKSLESAVLMHFDDIHEVNRQIKEAGDKKLKAMQRVALFRRQVIYKEWEHKVHKAHIVHLNDILSAVEKCKVTMEFLNILRNWDKVQAQREKYMAEGAIEKVIEQKIAAFRMHIDRVNVKIDDVKQKTMEMKRQNHRINDTIDRMKVDVALFSQIRDLTLEEKRDRERCERMERIKMHRRLLDTVRRDYAHILELQTILELLRLRTYPTLAPAPPQCPDKFY